MLIGFEIFFCVLPMLIWLYLWCVPNYTRVSTDMYFCFYCIWCSFSLYSVTVLARVRDCTCLCAPLYFCTCTCSCARLYLLVCATIPTRDCTSTCVCVQLYSCVVRNCTRVLCTTIFVCMVHAGVLIMVRAGRVRTWGANAGPHVLPHVVLICSGPNFPYEGWSLASGIRGLFFQSSPLRPLHLSYLDLCP
jgi:hypothetical protein